MNMCLKSRFSQNRSGGQHGSMLLELMIAIVVLATGMCGILPLLISAVSTNTRSASETNSTMLAEHVMEQIAAQQANQTSALTVTDCAGANWTIHTAGATSGGGNGGQYGGKGARLTSAGIIDWTQTYAGVPAGYAMKYTTCGAGGRQTIVDVRWDVITLSGTSRMIFVSGRPHNDTNLGGLRYVVPVNLVTVGGMP